MPDASKDNAILTQWQTICATFSSRRAVVSATGATLRTFADVEAEACAMEPLFDRFFPGHAVAVQIGNSECWPALLLALFRRQLVPLPLGRHMETGERQAALHACGVAALVTAEGVALHVESVGSEPILHSCQFLKLTSGTTSAPRAIRFSAGQLLADCENICDTMEIGPEDLNYGIIPVSHSYGFSNLLTPLLCRGVPLVISEDRMPRAILKGLAQTEATVFPSMPVFFDKLAALPGERPQLPALRLSISAGAPLPASVARAFSERFQLKIHSFYGSSECGGIGYDADENPTYEDGFVGAPMNGVSIISSVDDSPGPITVASGAVGEGYFPEADAGVLGEGRFSPPDLIRWSERGMHIAGRTSDVINIAGRKLNPGEIETRISQFPGVRQVIVFGIPSTLRGEEPVACIAGENLDRAVLLRLCSEQLSSWQVPRDFWIVDEIPANERGKISRRGLSEQFLAFSRDSSQT